MTSIMVVLELITKLMFRRMRKFMARHRWRKAIRAVRSLFVSAIENWTFQMVKTKTNQNFLDLKKSYFKKQNNLPGEDANTGKSSFCNAWRRRILVNSVSPPILFNPNPAPVPISNFIPVPLQFYLQFCSSSLPILLSLRFPFPCSRSLYTKFSDPICLFSIALDWA